MATNRQCETCGATYLRRNLVEIWTVRAEGRRDGWVKRLVRQCLRCQPTTLSLQLLRVMHVRTNVRTIGTRRRRPAA
jgi:ribosomal protein S27AE